MPRKKASIKDVRKIERRTEYNEFFRKKAKLALDTAKKSNYSEEKTQEAIKSLDKLAQKKIVHKNTAARKKSRLMKRANKEAKA